MPKIFISYRTEDSETIAGRIYDNLKHRYGKPSIIIDYESMVPGRDFRERLAELLLQSDILTAIVGTRWASRVPRKRGEHSTGPPDYRICFDDDWVRFEIETAMRRPIPVIPVLVHGADMPSPKILPESLRDFSYLHAQRVNDRQDFETHFAQLCAALDSYFRISPAAATSETRRNKSSTGETER